METLTNFKFWKKGQKFLGVDIPIISGAMTWISTSGLVRAVSEAGGFGFLAAGNMPVEILEKEIKKLQDENIHFGVNLITIAPNYQDHLDKAIELKVPHIVFAGSFPRRTEIEKAKQNGAQVMCFASTESIARRMIEYGTDALVLEGSEAGGHIGHVSTIILLQQVLFKFPDIPVFVAGGIATGKIIAHLFLMGACGVQMGTIFAMSEESPAHPDFKRRYQKARAREAFATPQYDSSLPIVAVRAIKNQGSENFGKLQLELLKELKSNRITKIEAQYEAEKFWAGALRRAVQEGDILTGSLMAGQSVGLVNEIKPVRKIIDDLVSEASREFEAVGRLLNQSRAR
jgi:enoyl-[acyl-carrier protein] reductase II